MLIPLTREKFEQLVPATATAEQYKYCWGKLPEVLKRLIISFVGFFVVYLVSGALGDAAKPFALIGAIVVVLYWLWGPVLWASLRNRDCRKHAYSGFWQGKVLDVYITEELIGTEENVNKRGELVIVENRERRVNVEVGDDTGFSTKIQVPLKRTHQSIRRGQVAELLVMSYEPDLSSIVMVSDVFIPNRKLWVSDYPYLRRDVFEEVSRQLRTKTRRAEPEPADTEREPPRRRREPTRSEEFQETELSDRPPRNRSRDSSSDRPRSRSNSRSDSRSASDRPSDRPRRTTRDTVDY